MDDETREERLGQLVDAFYNLVEIEERFGPSKADEVIDGLEDTQPYSLLKLAVHLTVLQRQQMRDDTINRRYFGDDPTLN